MGRKKNFEPVTIYARLREDYNECHEKMLSQAALGKMLGLSKSDVSRIENGEKEPSPEIKKKYSEIFGISIKVLSGTADNTDLKNLTVGALGLSDDTIATLQLLSEHSDKSQNLMALVNAFLGGGENTLLFFQQLFSFIKSKEESKEFCKHMEFKQKPYMLMGIFLGEYMEY